jgi:hypothetical protein
MQSSCISGFLGKFGLLLIKVLYVILAFATIALHVSPDCTTYVVLQSCPLTPKQMDWVEVISAHFIWRIPYK